MSLREKVVVDEYLLGEAIAWIEDYTEAYYRCEHKSDKKCAYCGLIQKLKKVIKESEK